MKAFVYNSFPAARSRLLPLLPVSMPIHIFLYAINRRGNSVCNSNVRPSTVLSLRRGETAPFLRAYMGH
jgi:hypothetical protein